MAVENLITEHIDIWTSAIKTKSTSDRGSSKKLELYGVKKLRELISELAVRGKLVPQDPNDEPASVLLERITAEKAQLVKEKKIEKPKALPPINDSKPFQIPNNWGWSQLGFLTNYGVCDKLEPKDASPSTWVLELEDVEKYTSRLLKKVRFEERVFKSTKNSFQKNDVIYGKLRPYLDKVLVADEDGACTTEMIPIRGYIGLIPEFIRLVLKTPYFIEYANTSTHGMNLPRMGTDKARAALFPLAPLNEQHRIVAKVDELMALCDQLEQQTEASIEAHQVLVTTLLDTLTNSADADELMQNWARISEHFDTLFTTEESIDQLKQTILQLAVMGKLVPQDPSDEPAAELLKRIAEEKAQLILKKEIPKTKKFEEISVQDNAFNAPSNWSWVRLETVFNVIVDCPHSTAKFQDEGLLCIDTNSFKQGQLHPNRFRFVSKETFDKRNARLVPKSRDIIFAREGSVGESVVIPEGVECCLGQRVMLFRPSESLNAEFLRLTISNKGALNQLLVLHKGIGAKHVNVGDMRAFVICLPPKMEQDRIVDKVNELLGLCELLKSSLKDFQSTQLYLTDAIVEQAV
ncbi:TPA: restriction endonuclease subunit S [Vibrio cholerae]|uniref:restriction endonuclease subunit S n=1 Tax=Vibrio cholerae TaxID=666 RepID=UPI001B81D8DF|nr:restriction endonuclease subunit S [Vibrio cholerae]EIU7584399.1 restriction endonuclease subunit S [Vibrio cholerae]EJL6496347.1 restriction endonuclease subunit S [Vibrio cholerae]EJL6571398.1 restriction endonuclease subunit S [Vibrio cholerae]EJL6612985.1 restriction endonuclease subunit S [Vibrio cholerae]EJL9431561.1 restriction endonuclease subunit S [Vibrio cholerae]